MIRSGFYNSKNHDKLYYNSDISRLFNALIIDGVFQNIGDTFIAKPGTGMQVIIPSGMAYFNSTWIFNDTDYVQAIDAAPIVDGFSRIDGIFLKMGPVDDQNTRENTIYYMAGTPASQDVQKPVPTVEDGEVYIPICYVTVASSVTSITDSMIENCVGVTETTPFVTGILETVEISELLTQWESQWNDWLNTEKTDFESWAEDRQTAFTEWFENLQYVLDGDVAGHLQNEIDELQPVRKRTITNLLNPTADTMTENGITCTNNGDGTYTLNGTATATTQFYIASNYTLKKGTYRITGCPSGGSYTTYKQGLWDSELQDVLTDEFGSGKTFTIDSDTLFEWWRIVVYNGATLSNLVFKPMLTTDLYATYDEFVQYSGDGELNENVAEHEKDIAQINKDLSEFSDGDAITDAFTVASGFTISAQTLRKIGENIVIYLKFSGSASTASNGELYIGKIASDYAPSVPVTCACYINRTTSGQIFATATAYINTSGAVYIIPADVGINTTIGSSSYPWSTNRGIYLNYHR